MRLIASPPGKIESGVINFENRNLLSLPEKQMQKIRGCKISMIFQDPMTSLNPVFTCGYQIGEMFEQHRETGSCEQLLSEVGIPDTFRVMNSYPHQLSGGMRQRVMIAMALSCTPKLLIADEPTTALDVTVQARLLDLLKSLQETKGMSMLLITHNMGIVANMAHEVMVMYAGEVMEHAPTEELFNSPLHPYTRSLLETIPSLDKKSKKLPVIPGDVPAPNDLPSGCSFHPRCSKAFSRCKIDHPEIHEIKPGHTVRCHLYE
ncbi:Oligopeptide transport ATP-binding protein OppD [Chitinispirillum alkaliphilum]|nr:Oligopeptide transport ATP-binding protein OppD [Chitinispirillum alkaliphilum]